MGAFVLSCRNEDDAAAVRLPQHRDHVAVRVTGIVGQRVGADHAVSRRDLDMRPGLERWQAVAGQLELAYPRCLVANGLDTHAETREGRIEMLHVALPSIRRLGCRVSLSRIMTVLNFERKIILRRLATIP